MFSDNEIHIIIDKLILDGGIELGGIHPVTNEMLYRFTPKLKEIMPELYEEHLNAVNSDLMGLWEKGFLDIDLFKDDPTISLTKKATEYEEVSKLSAEEQWALADIVYSMSEEL
jgi:hypothetical protein